jgi:hypothetical protein
MKTLSRKPYMDPRTPHAGVEEPLGENPIPKTLSEGVRPACSRTLSLPDHYFLFSKERRKGIGEGQAGGRASMRVAGVEIGFFG